MNCRDIIERYVHPGSEHFDGMVSTRRHESDRRDRAGTCLLGKLSVLLIAGALCAAAPAADSGKPVARVPILGWHSIPEDQLSMDRFRQLADMGLTHSLMHYSPAGNARALDLAAETGVQLFVGDRRFAQPGEELKQAAQAYRDHPALAGYLLRDEPSVGDFAALAASRDALEAVDPDHWSYVNLFPTYASSAQLGCETYPGHVRRFFLEFRPEVLSFDHYPILEGDQLRRDFFQNLEWIRQISLEFETPFWAFALTCPHRPYPMPTLGHIRFQTWSNFAYGAKGLQYFTYWTPRPGTWDFHDAPIRLDGTCSPTWDLLKAFNQEVQACADILLDSRVVAVYHTEPLPAGTRRLDVSSPFSRIDGGEAVVGLHQMPDGKRYALVVNRSFNKAVTLRLTLQDWVRDVDWTQRAEGVEFVGVAERQITLRCEPGAAGFLHLNASSKAIPGIGRLAARDTTDRTGACWGL